uniref:Transcription factor CBF/NF-Y/archaeal histone domain-containing protein n=1 Tax=Kalanchoe fedtschenkoi TaxID=63787 RepID=A0A7N0TTD6_KALFE
MADNAGSNVSECSLKHTHEAESSGTANREGVLKEQDHLLPIANVGRIMKQILPPNAKISKEAKETMQECVSEFINFVTGDASDKCRKEKRKTLNGDDICWALGSLGFDDYAYATKRYLRRYRDLESERADQNRVGNNEQKDMEPPRNNPVAVSGTITSTINFIL